MSEPNYIDPAELRAQALESLREAAATFFAEGKCSSVMMLVAQYWADEADDAVHTNFILSQRETPVWPHLCDYDGEPDGRDLCGYCGDSRVSDGLDDNETAVFAFAAFCHEGGSQESGVEENYLPFAVARRAKNGGVELEVIGELQRPWLDMPGAFAQRGADWDAPPPVDRPVEKPAPLQGREAELLTRILTNPLENGPRQILCDLLAERDDPRGEFGALSFTENPTPQIREKLETLASKHGRSWLGPLAEVIPYSGAEFGNGPFLRSAQVYFADANVARAHHDDAEWATVERLRFLPGSVDYLSPQMRGLREVGPLRVRGVEQLSPAVAPWAIEKLDVRLEGRAIEALAKCATLPRLRHLRVSGLNLRQVTMLERAPFWSSLETFELAFAGEEWSGLLRRPAALTEWLQRAQRISIGVVRLGPISEGGNPTGWWIELARTHGSTVATIAFAGPGAQSAFDALRETVQVLGPLFPEVTLGKDHRWRPSLEELEALKAASQSAKLRVPPGAELKSAPMALQPVAPIAPVIPEPPPPIAPVVLVSPAAVASTQLAAPAQVIVTPVAAKSVATAETKKKGGLNPVVLLIVGAILAALAFALSKG
jgi:hypothetical protein